MLESQARFRTLFGRFAVNASLVVASILFFAILVELGLRFFHPVYEAVAGSQYDRDKLRIWAPRANRVRQVRHPDTGIQHFVIQNSLRLRQSREFDDLPTATNLAFFGDSYTVNNGLPAQYSFTEPLDYLLNRGRQRFNVLNFGVDGYGSDQEYLYYLEVAPDIHLAKVFYVLCANDLRNIYETNLFSLNEQGELVRNPLPKSAWWIRPLSRLHITYFALDLRQRILYSRTGNLEEYRASMEQSAAKEVHQQHHHDERADTLQQKFLESESNEDLARSVRLFQHIMERWRDAVESSGAEFYVVLLPTGREELFKAVLGEKFRVISLLDLFNGADGSFEWRTIQFKQDGHWAEEGNRLAALHLYKVLTTDFGLDASETANPEQSLVGYYSAFENGWMPKDAAATDLASPEERSRIRDKYIALELRRQARRLSAGDGPSPSVKAR